MIVNIKEVFDSVQIENDIATMYIYGDISSEKYTDWYDDMEHTEVYPKFVVDFLKAIEDKELHIHINSPGGNAYAGVAIYNLLKERKGKTVTHIDCIAASAASLIALAGDEIVMSIGSVLMIHRPWIRAVGNSDELRKTADDLDKLGDCIFEIYKNSLANSEDEKKVRELYNSEAWLSNADCVELFKNIKIDAGSKACAAVRSDMLERYKLPANIKIAEASIKVTEKNKKKNDNNLEKMKMEIAITEALLDN